MRGLAAVVLALVLAVAMAMPAMAQQVTLEPSDALKCLTPAAAERGAPAYPLEAYKREQKGSVKVRLRFAGPDARPAVTVLAQEGDDSFVLAVQDHVRKMRVPCQASGAAPVQLDFEFVFRPEERQVLASAGLDADAAERRAQVDCMVHTSGEKQPVYPDDALREHAQGRVLVQLRFEARDQPPVVQVFTRAGPGARFSSQRVARMLVRPAEHWVQGYRMPCLQGPPITTVVSFFYRIEGSPYGFKPGLTLRELLPMVRNIRLQRLDFDFTRMGCPFDVKLQYRQPHLPNVVAELSDHDPARRPFLDWLRQSSLDLSEDALDSVYGDTARFTVPCLKIDLNPSKD